MAIRTAVGIAIFRRQDGERTEEHWHRIFSQEMIELAKQDNMHARLLAEEECKRAHGHRGELVEIVGSLYRAPRTTSSFTVLLPQDASYKAPRLPDGLFIES
ncbi:hypothetical protein HY406_01315 [Candidatus Giovannonibacteria bacterium]|nr:hypothetical protein [Candidatus Giovannonibacteria bacterium]